jgi:hypothetical protein
MKYKKIVNATLKTASQMINYLAHVPEGRLSFNFSPGCDVTHKPSSTVNLETRVWLNCTSKTIGVFRIISHSQFFFDMNELVSRASFKIPDLLPTV